MQCLPTNLNILSTKAIHFYYALNFCISGKNCYSFIYIYILYMLYRSVCMHFIYSFNFDINAPCLVPPLMKKQFIIYYFFEWYRSIQNQWLLIDQWTITSKMLYVHPPFVLTIQMFLGVNVKVRIKEARQNWC